MIENTAATLRRLLGVLRRSSPVARATRLLLALLAVLLTGLLAHWAPSGSGFAHVMAVLQLVVVLGLCRWPDSMLLVALPLPVALWCLASHPGWAAVGLLAAVLWVVRRLAALAGMAPSHAVVAGAAVRRVVVDAALEAGLVGIAGLLVAAGVGLSHVLPGGPWWALGLLGAVLVSVFWLRGRDEG